MADAGGGDRGPIADDRPGRLRARSVDSPIRRFVGAARAGPAARTRPGRALTGVRSGSPPLDPPERPSRPGAFHVPRRR